MPTYSFACPVCHRIVDHVMSISHYVNARPSFVCCGVVSERHISVAPAMALHNALASERHYDGMRAPDGADISSRAKHRAYMKEHNLTTVDDFSETWKRNRAERVERLAGEDPTRRTDIAEAVQKLRA